MDSLLLRTEDSLLLTTEDNTAVIDMKRDFEAFIAPSAKKIRSHLNFSNTAAGDVSSFSTSRDQSSVSMKQLLEKERLDREREVNLIKASTKITELEGKLNSAETSRKRSRVEFEQEIDTYRCHQNTDSLQIQRLKEQLRAYVGKEEDLRQQLKDYRADLLKTKAGYEHKVLSLQKDNHQTQEQLQTLEQQYCEKELALMNKTLKLTSDLEISRLETEQNKQQLQNALRRCSQLSSQLQAGEETRIKSLAAEEKIKDLQNQLSQYERDAVITRNMKDQLDRLQQLEKDNRSLRTDNEYRKTKEENVFLLREEAESLRGRLERAEKRSTELDQLKLENEDMQRRLAIWENVSDGGSPKALSASEIKRRFSDLQTSNSCLLDRQGSLHANARALERSVQTRDKELQSLRDQLETEKIKEVHHRHVIKQLNRKLLLLTKERDSQRGILDSYEKEVDLKRDTAVTAKLRQLQENLQRYQRHQAVLEGELEQAQGELLQTRTRSKLVENELQSQRQRQRLPSVSEADGAILAQIRGQVATLEKTLEDVTEVKERLEEQLERKHLQGEYDPAVTKVLHLRCNPVSRAQQQRQQKVADLEENNQKLLTRLQVLQDSEGDVDDLTVKVQARLDGSHTDKQVDELRSQIKSAELKNQRLMEVFKKKSQEFRESVYCLLGYMVQLPTDNQYKLLNMYADSPSDALLFQRESDGNMQLLQTEYSESLQDKIEVYLTQGNSIPAFLSHLTMDLFSRQTMMQ